MSRPAPPVLTVRYQETERTFAAGSDVVIGRDLRADVRVAHPLISRTHLLVRYEQGRWIAIDNGSLNGLYVNNRRVPAVDIQDGLRVNIGNPDGPALTFEVGRHQGSAGRPPLTTSIPIVNAPAGSSAHAPHGPPQAGAHLPGQPHPPPSASFRHAAPAPAGSVPGHPPEAEPRYPSAGPPGGPSSGPQQAPHIYRAPPMGVPAPVREPRAAEAGAVGGDGDGDGDGANIATSMMRMLRPGKTAVESMPGAIKIGRANDNDIVIPEVLASRHHATLIPTLHGTEIHDNRSINGT
ncbi:MAG: FHA domain-containing protein, partial [Mycobacterium sp.]|nr:FHA domain-containing protein [Mycobacterium sp.]